MIYERRSRQFPSASLPRWSQLALSCHPIVQLELGSLPNKMRVEVEPDIEVSAKTVGELRKVTAWPETLAVTTPQERHADSAVKVSKVSVATRTAPKT